MDSTSLLNQISVNQAEKEVTANENFAAASPAMLYARNAVTSVGLTWGFTGGRYFGTEIASGTVALTLSVTNYLVASATTGAVTVATTTTNWNNTTGFIRLYLIAAGASTVTSYQDFRQAVGVVGGGATLSANTFTGTQTMRAGAISAGSAPIKMQSGALNTTPEVGAVEFLTDTPSIVITTGAARKELTLNDAPLTSGRLPFATTNGRLTDSAALAFDANNNLSIGTAALATTATNGFLYIPTCAGTPTGTPTTKTGLAPMIVDSTALKFWVYVGGAWKSAQLV